MSDRDDLFGGAEPRRFLRFVCEFEVEVTDRIQAAAYTWDLGQDESGEPGMVPYSNPNEQMQAAVMQALNEALRDSGERAGFRLLWGPSVKSRRVGEDGRYAPDEFPSTPVRREDGTLDL